MPLYYKYGGGEGGEGASCVQKSSSMPSTVLWIRDSLNPNQDPPDPAFQVNPIRIQDFDDQKLEKNTAEKNIMF